MTTSDTVLYAAYGSNLSPARLACYLAGGTPAGAHTTHAAPVRPLPPADPVGLATIRGRLRAAGWSDRWQSAASDVDLDGSSDVVVALYRTAPQALLQLWAGEAGVDPDTVTSLPAAGDATLDGAPDAWASLTEVDAVPLDGSAPVRAWVVHTGGRALAAPAVGDTYLETMVDGLVAHGMSRCAAVDLLSPIAPR